MDEAGENIDSWEEFEDIYLMFLYGDPATVDAVRAAWRAEDAFKDAVTKGADAEALRRLREAQRLAEFRFRVAVRGR